MNAAKYIVVVVVVFAVVVFTQFNTPSSINWTPTYSSKHTYPFGTKILFDELKKLNKGHEVLVQDQTPYEYLDYAEQTAGGKSSLIIIQSAGYIDNYEWEKIFNYAGRGNTVFISSDKFYSEFLDSMGIFSNTRAKGFNSDDTAYYSNFVNPLLRAAKPYAYSFAHDYGYFSMQFAEGNPKILSVINGKEVDYIQVPYGEGKLFFHSNPKAFTNYYLVKDNNYEYAFKALSYLPAQPILWDEKYKMPANEKDKDGQIETGSSLSYILSKQEFRWAYNVLLLGLLLYFLFRVKRMQKAIPVIEPLANTSLEFTETVGRLYYNRGDHLDIAIKKINYLLQHILAKYHLRYRENDPEFVKNLAEKSGVTEKDVKYLAWKIADTRKKRQFTADELMDLNKKIDEFYKKAK